MTAQSTPPDVKRLRELLADANELCPSGPRNGPEHQAWSIRVHLAQRQIFAALPALLDSLEAVPAEGEALARLFHDTYERLAPSFGYETRADTKAFDPETPNGRLMIAVCGQIAASLSRPQPEPEGSVVERVARAICQSKDLNPDCLYQHNEGEDWPEDSRNEYIDAFTKEPRVMLFHKAWRHSEKAARAALAAMPQPVDREAVLRVLEPLANAGAKWIGPDDGVLLKLIDGRTMTVGHLRRARELYDSLRREGEGL